MKPAFRVGAAEAETFDRGNGVVTRLLMGKHNGANVTTGTTTWPPGQSAPMHSHNCAEQVFILSGAGQVVYDGGEFEVATGDTSFIAANVAHRFINTGAEALVMLFIYDSEQVTRTFTATGQTVSHLSARDKVE